MHAGFMLLSRHVMAFQPDLNLWRALARSQSWAWVLSLISRRHRDNIGVLIGFNEPTARRIVAGSDFTLMPSRFEPCGLTQMQAQRYGALPIAHATGGLADTIDDGTT